jgi:uncharacterized membrane protein YoaT (DUF817 family)
MNEKRWDTSPISKFSENSMIPLFRDFLTFIYKQAYACIFWGFLVLMIIVTKYYYPLEGMIYRYDFLFFSAVAFQIFLIAMKLESWKEVGIIAIFHSVALWMEVFKTHPSIGSWQYPEAFSIGILGVPLFAGFMYSAVGSYIARVWRIFEFRFTWYPKKIYTILIALAIYINFFTHHFIWDFRYIILVFILLTFWRTVIFFKPNTKYYSMNLAFWFLLVAFVIWIAENIATMMNIWIYPSQAIIWQMVWPEKILAWYLLMIISFVLVSLIHQPQKYKSS